MGEYKILWNEKGWRAKSAGLNVTRQATRNIGEELSDIKTVLATYQTMGRQIHSSLPGREKRFLAALFGLGIKIVASGGG